MGSLKSAVARIWGLLLGGDILHAVGRPGIWLIIVLTVGTFVLFGSLIARLIYTGAYSSDPQRRLDSQRLLCILLGRDMPPVPPPVREEAATSLTSIPRPRHSADRAPGTSSTLRSDAAMLSDYDSGGDHGVVSRSDEIGSEDLPAVLWS